MVVWPARPSRIVLALGAAILAAVLGVPGVAVAASRDVPMAGPLPVVPVNVPDRVISRAGAARVSAAADRMTSRRGPAHASAAGVTQGARTRSYRTTDGQRVEVAVSSAYPVDTLADQAYVDFIATRVHGRELSGLRLFVGRPAEISKLCGGDAVIACYAPDEQRMFVPGEDTQGVPMEYAITHEYGHHIASWRRNDPWDSIDWGPKYWSSTVGVCAAVARHQLFVGGYDRHYFDNPGEGFADGYAHLHYPADPWRYNALMRPDAAVRDAIRRDVADPWTGPQTRVLRGGRSGTLRLHVRLDGDVTVKLAARHGARFRLEAHSDGWAIGRSLGSSGQLGIEWCRKTPGDSDITLTVHRRAGSGPFRLTVRYPG